MAANEIDLWPTDLLDQVDTIRTPLAILREQAELLGKKSNNLVEARVKTNQRNPEVLLVTSRKPLSGLGGGNPNEFITERGTAENAILIQSFNLVSSVLGYTYQLFYVTHPIQGYPLAVYFEGQVSEANSEDELLTILKEIFSSEKTKRIIEAMVAQSVA